MGREKKNQNDYYPLIQQVADGSSFTKKAMSGGINRFVQRRDKKFCSATINVSYHLDI